MNLTPQKLAIALYALAVLGAALVVAGVAMVSAPAGFIVGGLALAAGAGAALFLIDVSSLTR